MIPNSFSIPDIPFQRQVGDYSLQTIASYYSIIFSILMVVLLLGITIAICFRRSPQRTIICSIAIFVAYGYALSLSDLNLIHLDTAYYRALNYVAFAVLMLTPLVFWPTLFYLIRVPDRRLYSVLTALVITSLLGTGVLKESWLSWDFDPGPVRYIDVSLRDVTFMVSAISAWDNDLVFPLLQGIFHGGVLLIATIVLQPFLWCGRKSTAYAFICAAVLHAIVMLPFFIEASVAYLCALWFGFTFEKSTAREIKQQTIPRRFRRAVVAIIIATIVCTVGYFILYKAVFIAAQKRWDLVCLGYMVWGLVIGRLGGYAAGVGSVECVERHSLDEGILSVFSQGAQRPRIRFRFDTAVLLAPYVGLGLLFVAAGYLRQWTLGARYAFAALAVIAIIAAIAVMVVHRQYRATSRIQEVTHDHRTTITELSRLSHEVGTLDMPTFVFLVLIPVVTPFIVGLLVGFDSSIAPVASMITATVAWFICVKLIRWHHGRPPSVVVLAASGRDGIGLHGGVSRSIRPLRAVSLLAMGAAGGDEVRLPPRRDCLRTIWSSGWRSIVADLCRITPVIVLDSRQKTPPTQDELKLLRQHNWLNKTIIVCNPDGTAPLLDDEPMLKECAQFRVCKESELSEVVQVCLRG